MPQSLEQLEAYIGRSLAAGSSPEAIRSSLLAAGWAEDSVAHFFSQSGALVPPPPPPAKSTGRDVFFALLTFFTLGISAISLGGIIFALLNSVYPDAVALPYYDPAQAVRPALASFLVAAPVFYAMCWRLVRDGAVGTINLRSGVRKVLTYLALFLASATIIGDIITLIIQFLGGTANVRVWLKVLVVLLIGAWVIYYYWASLKREERDQLTSNRWQKTNGYVFIVVALAALFVGFTLSGNPQDQQGVVRDQQRVSDLQQLYAGVQSFYQQKGKMPQTLEEASSGYLSTLPQDPQTGTAYEYTALSGSSFELCATFETDDAVRGRPTEPLIYPVGSTNWTHPSGRHCFNLDAKPVGLLKP